MEMSLKGYRTALEALGKPQDHIEASLGHRTVQGVVSSVDDDAGRITLQTRGGAELTLDVTDNTRVRAEGQDLNLSDLAPGDLVTVTYNRDSSAAIEIRVKTESKAQGTIQTVDSTNHRLIVELTDGTALTLTVTEQSKIEMNREIVSIDELPAGSQVELEYNPATMELLKIEADTQAEVEGTISSIDTKANTITILTEDGAELSVDITDNTRINIQRILSALTGLSEGMAVKVKYNSATEEALEIKAEHRRSNEKNKDRVTGTVTIRAGTR
jgi:glycine cleavage system H lipoate-binding protein